MAEAFTPDLLQVQLDLQQAGDYGGSFCWLGARVAALFAGVLLTAIDSRTTHLQPLVQVFAQLQAECPGLEPAADNLLPTTLSCTTLLSESFWL